MTWFNCACGESFQDRENELSPSGINIRLQALNNLEKNIAIKLDEYFALDIETQHKWALNELGVSYTPERKKELIEDIDSLKFVICKATEGTTFTDTTFKDNWELLGKKKIIRGAYHFYDLRKSPKDQAEYFLSVIKKVKGIGENDISPVLDIERLGIHSKLDPKPKDLQKAIKEFSGLKGFFSYKQKI